MNISTSLPFRYEYLSPLGTGGESTVFLVFDKKLQQPVALKLLKEAGKFRWSYDFFQTFQKLKSLSHPSVVPYIDYGYTLQRQPFLISTYIDGKPLLPELVGYSSADHLISNFIIPILKIVRELSLEGIFHGDLKSENIIFSHNPTHAIYFIDFPMNTRAIFSANDDMGSLPYLSPERISHQPVDSLSELYSIGCLVYEWVIGNRLSDRFTYQKLLTWHHSEKEIKGSDILSQWLRIALHPEKHNRFKTIEEAIVFLSPTELFIRPDEKKKISYFGYEREASTLNTVLQKSSSEFISITGVKGIGKTSLIRTVLSSATFDPNFHLFLSFKGRSTPTSSELTDVLLQVIETELSRLEDHCNWSLTEFGLLEQWETLSLSTYATTSEKLPTIFGFLAEMSKYIPMRIFLDADDVLHSYLNNKLYLPFAIAINSLSEKPISIQWILCGVEITESWMDQSKQWKKIHLSGWNDQTIKKFLHEVYPTTIIIPDEIIHWLKGYLGHFPSRWVNFYSELSLSNYPNQISDLKEKNDKYDQVIQGILSDPMVSLPDDTKMVISIFSSVPFNLPLSIIGSMSVGGRDSTQIIREISDLELIHIQHGDGKIIQSKSPMISQDVCVILLDKLSQLPFGKTKYFQAYICLLTLLKKEKELSQQLLSDFNIENHYDTLLDIFNWWKTNQLTPEIINTPIHFSLLDSLFSISIQRLDNIATELFFNLIETIPDDALSKQQILTRQVMQVAFHQNMGDYKDTLSILGDFKLSDLTLLGKWQSKYYLLMAQYYYQYSNYTDALSQCQFAYIHSVNLENDSDLLDTTIIKCRIYGLGLNDQEKFHQEALKIVKILELKPDKFREGQYYLIQSYYLLEIGQYEEFKVMIQKAMSGLYESSSWKLYASALNLFGVSELRLLNIQSALNYFEKSLRIRSMVNDQKGYYVVLSNMVLADIHFGQFDKAKQSIHKIIDFRLQSKDKLGLAYAKIKNGYIFFYQGDYHKAFNELKESSGIFQEIMNSKYLFECNCFAFRCKLNLNDYSKNDLDELVEINHEPTIWIGLVYVEYGLKTNDPYYVQSGLQIIEENTQQLELVEFPLQDFYLSVYKGYAFLSNRRKAMEWIRKAQQVVYRVSQQAVSTEAKNNYFHDYALNKEIIDICNSDQIDTSQEDLMILKLIQESVQKLNSSHSTDELLSEIIELVKQHISADRVILFLLDKNEKDLAIKQSEGVEPGSILEARRIAHQVIFSSQKGNSSFYSDKAQLDDRLKESINVKELNIQSILCVPLIKGNKKIGALYAESRISSHIFKEKDYHFLEIFANFSAIAIHTRQIQTEIKEENQLLKKQYQVSTSVGSSHSTFGITGRSKSMEKVFQLISAAAKNDSPVLIIGESGTGKELVARAIFQQGLRIKHPYLPVDCGSLSESLLESELFGHKKGSFTGANEDKKGLFEAADLGTLFLDEITNTTLALQARLLRALQEGEIRRVGDTTYRKVNVRIIAATNQDISKLIAEQKFRHDLYYRLNVMTITIPPLRDRMEDIPLIIQDYLNKRLEINDQRRQLSPTILKYFTSYDWPGNVRELLNKVDQILALTTSDKPIVEDDIHMAQLNTSEVLLPSSLGSDPVTFFKDEARTNGLKQTIEWLEEKLIREELETVDGKMTDVAKRFKLANSTLADKMKKYHIEI